MYTRCISLIEADQCKGFGSIHHIHTEPCHKMIQSPVLTTIYYHYEQT